MRAIVLEASQALAHLDADRLEELARCCQSLNRTTNRTAASSGVAERTTLGREAEAIMREMEVFARVLEATRANLRVLRRLRDMRSEPSEYTALPGRN
jgi:hypothetical protein